MLNVRGIRTFEKRKALFQWLKKDQSDIFFLQETYSTPEIENTWRTQWRGDLFFAHGSEHSKGVLILIKECLDFKLDSVKLDQNGRFILLVASVQGQPFIFVNIYAPNITNEQCTFFEAIQSELDELDIDTDCNIIMGGDFNVILDPVILDGIGSKPRLKDSVKKIENICSSFDLVDIWRIRNPIANRFSWRQKTLLIQLRLDFWLIGSNLQEDIDKADIVPAIKSDHSAITLSINGIQSQVHGPSFWKFNASLLDDED